jgi:zinc protease
VIRVLHEESHDLPLAELQLVLLGGPAADARGLEGLARHSLELMRRGAGGRTRAENDAALDALGAQVELSAGHDAVGVHLTCLTRHLDAAVALVADMLLAPRVDADEHERLRREELAALDDLRDDDAALAVRFFDRLTLPGHPYGRSALGSARSLAALTPALVEDWIARNVVAGNLLVGFSGDLDAARAQALADAAFAALPVRPPPAPVVFPEPSVPAGRRAYVVDKPDRRQTQLVIGHPGPPMAHPDFLALHVACTAFGGSFTSRLNQEVRVKRGWSYGASFGAVRTRGGHCFRLRCAPAIEQTADTVALVLGLWEEAVARGLSDDEVEHARRYLEGAFAFDTETAGSRLEQRIALITLGLPADTVDRFVERVRAVDGAAANAALRAHWSPAGATTVLTATAEELVPRLADLPIGPIEVLGYEED